MCSYFRSIFVMSVFLYSIHFSAMAYSNCMSSDVFDNHNSGQKALNPARVTNAFLAHENGLKGRTKTGKRLLAAVIDCAINANLPHMKELTSKKLIHPDALPSNNPLMMTTEEELDQYSLIEEKLLNDIAVLSNEHYDLNIKKIYSSSEPPEDQHKLQQQIERHKISLNVHQKKIEGLRERIALWGVYNKSNEEAHGAGVIHALHKIAPEASILPIDLTVMRLQRNNSSLTRSQALTEAIRAAIDHGQTLSI